MTITQETIPWVPEDIFFLSILKPRKRYFFLLGALRLVNATSPRTISIDKKKISSGTQGKETMNRSTPFSKNRDLVTLKVRKTVHN